MKKYALLSTFYCRGCVCPDKEIIREKFNYDGKLDDLHINFSDKFDPWNLENCINVRGRRDLIQGKIFQLKEYIENNILNKYVYVSHIDFSDTRFARSFIEMMEEFEKTKQDFIISTEKKCWPYFSAVKPWVNYDLTEEEFYFVNSGALISKTEVLYNYLIKLMELCKTNNIDYWDDQGVWQYYHLIVEKLNSDRECKYFFSTALLDDSYYTLEDNKIRTKFGTYPYLVHDNSSFSLNLRGKINYNLYKIPNP
jgi:hypothetical protein